LADVAGFVEANAGAFLGTLLGVVVGFSLDRWAAGRTDARSASRLADELRTIEGLLADAMVYNFNLLGAIVSKLTTSGQGREETANFRMAAWDVNAPRFMQLCQDPQEKTDFAIFFEELARLRELGARQGSEQVGGSATTARADLKSLKLAIEIAAREVPLRGTPERASSSRIRKWPCWKIWKGRLGSCCLRTGRSPLPLFPFLHPPSPLPFHHPRRKNRITATTTAPVMMG
jgi:hypothetical protein